MALLETLSTPLKMKKVSHSELVAFKSQAREQYVIEQFKDCEKPSDNDFRFILETGVRQNFEAGFDAAVMFLEEKEN